MDKDDAKAERLADDREEDVRAKPPVELHDPFGSFDFEPTDGGSF